MSALDHEARAAPTQAIASTVDRFYDQALRHANVWSLASVLAAVVGLVVIVWEVIQANGRTDLEAGLKAVTGLLVEAVAALFYRQANATRKHAADLLNSTQSDRRLDSARQILSTIQDSDLRHDIACRLILRLAGDLPARRAVRMSRSAATPDAPPSRRCQSTSPPADHELAGTE
jgi:hypothetical protein